MTEKKKPESNDDKIKEKPSVPLEWLVMQCTSINHCKNSNFQIDYRGIKPNCISDFEDWCIKNDVIWAHLFDIETGDAVATYNADNGLLAVA
jgi:hypothetical protein